MVKDENYKLVNSYVDGIESTIFGFKLTEMQIEIVKLWEEHKEYGLMIQTSRQVGKSLIACIISKEELNKGNAVVMLCWNKKDVEKKRIWFSAHNVDTTNMFFVIKSKKNYLDGVPKPSSKTLYIEDELIESDGELNRNRQPYTFKIHTELEDGYYNL